MYNSSLILLDVTIPAWSISWWLILLPVMLFLLFAILLFIRIKKSSITLSELLAEKNVVIAQQRAVAEAAATSTPPAPVPPAPASTSRLIVLLTGITALIVTVCLTSFWIYGYINDPAKKGPDFSNLTTLLITLGIGVVPYGFNQISSSSSKNN